MATVTILGCEYEAQPLNEADRWRYILMIRQLIADENTAIEQISKPAFMGIVTRVDAVQQLVRWTRSQLEVNERNAVEIFFALLPLIENKPQTLTGAEALQALREAT